MSTDSYPNCQTKSPARSLYTARDATKHGYLKKRVDRKVPGLSKYDVRYVIIYRGWVYYYKDMDSDKPQNTFSLQGYNPHVIPAEEECNTSHPYVFKIFSSKRTRERTWYFATENEYELRHWIEAFKTEISRYNPTKDSNMTYIASAPQLGRRFEDQEVRPVSNSVHGPPFEPELDPSVWELQNNQHEDSAHNFPEIFHHPSDPRRSATTLRDLVKTNTPKQIPGIVTKIHEEEQGFETDDSFEDDNGLYEEIDAYERPFNPSEVESLNSPIINSPPPPKREEKPFYLAPSKSAPMFPVHTFDHPPLIISPTDKRPASYENDSKSHHSVELHNKLKQVLKCEINSTLQRNMNKFNNEPTRPKFDLPSSPKSPNLTPSASKVRSPERTYHIENYKMDKELPLHDELSQSYENELVDAKIPPRLQELPTSRDNTLQNQQLPQRPTKPVHLVQNKPPPTLSPKLKIGMQIPNMNNKPLPSVPNTSNNKLIYGPEFSFEGNSPPPTLPRGDGSTTLPGSSIPCEDKHVHAKMSTNTSALTPPFSPPGRPPKPQHLAVENSHNDINSDKHYDDTYIDNQHYDDTIASPPLSKPILKSSQSYENDNGPNLPLKQTPNPAVPPLNELQRAFQKLKPSQEDTKPLLPQDEKTRRKEKPHILSSKPNNPVKNSPARKAAQHKEAWALPKKDISSTFSPTAVECNNNTLTAKPLTKPKPKIPVKNSPHNITSISQQGNSGGVAQKAKMFEQTLFK